MKAWILLALLSTTANAGMVDIKLLKDSEEVIGHGCEWRFMNEDGTPHPNNPMYGTAYKGVLKSGTRWIVSINCGSLGSGSHQIISSNSKEEYIIQHHE